MKRADLLLLRAGAEAGLETAAMKGGLFSTHRKPRMLFALPDRVLAGTMLSEVPHDPVARLAPDPLRWMDAPRFPTPRWTGSPWAGVERCAAFWGSPSRAGQAGPGVRVGQGVHPLIPLWLATPARNVRPEARRARGDPGRIESDPY